MDFKPNFALGFVTACTDGYREENKTINYQAFRQLSIIISSVNEINAANRLIVTAGADNLVIVWPSWFRNSNAYFGFNKISLTSDKTKDLQVEKFALEGLL